LLGTLLCCTNCAGHAAIVIAVCGDISLCRNADVLFSMGDEASFTQIMRGNE
jgi:hypothetical protein